MKNFRIINISDEELEKLKSRRIGEGRDAVVYKGKKNLLYKIYKPESQLNDLSKNQFKAKTKIYDKNNRPFFKNYKTHNHYVDRDGVRIYYGDAIKKIAERQKEIKLSNLPISPIYNNDKFIGCVIKKIYGFQLHYIWMFLSKKRKIKILKEILCKIKELTDSYIYPCDLDNSPLVGNHSNILINFSLKPQLIDLDGNSTIYRESYDEESLKLTYFSLNRLFMELLYGFILEDSLEYNDIENIKSLILKSGIDNETIDKMMEFSLNYEELDNLVNTLSLKK